MIRFSARSATIVAAAMSACAVLGCGTWYGELQAPMGRVSGDYADALRAHTVRGWHNQGVYRLVTVTATLHAPAFLEARLAEQARLMGVAAADATELRRDLPLSVEGTAVLVFIEAVEPAWERLDRANPVWHVHLDVGGVLHPPATIRRVDERDATVQHLFPYVNRFGRAWLLTFPVEEIGPEPVLSVSGAPARLRLQYRLDGGYVRR